MVNGFVITPVALLALLLSVSCSVLVLHLKRFRFTLTGRLEKVDNKVLLSRDLELSCGTGTVALSQSCSKYHIVLSSDSVFCTHEVNTQRFEELN